MLDWQNTFGVWVSPNYGFYDTRMCLTWLGGRFVLLKLTGNGGNIHFGIEDMLSRSTATYVPIKRLLSQCYATTSSTDSSSLHAKYT